MSEGFYEDFKRLFESNGLGRCVSRETSEKFEYLERALVETNEKYNLTAITDREGIIVKHFADSVFASGQLPQNAKVVDVGAGAGFPSLPLAIIRPDLKIVALDSTAKKLAFVSKTAEGLGLCNVSVLAARAEEAGRTPEHREKYDASVSRAVARTDVLCELCLPLVRKGGLFIALKGPSGQEEALGAEQTIKLLGGDRPVFAEYPLITKDGEEKRTLVIAEKKQYTPSRYPRPYTQIAKEAARKKNG